MANRVQQLRNDNADFRPNPVDVLPGGFATNRAAESPGVFFRDTTDRLIKVGPAHVGPIPPNLNPSGYAGNCANEEWIDTNFDPPVRKVWDGAKWVQTPGFENGNVLGTTFSGGWLGDRNELRNPGFIKYQRPWPNSKNIVVEGWGQENSSTTATYTSVAGAIINTGGYSNRLDIAITPGTQPDRLLRLHQVLANQSRYSGSGMALSFHARSSVPTKIAAEIFSNPITAGTGADVPIVGPVIFNLDTTWRSYSLAGLIPETASMPPPTGRRVGARFWLDAGSSVPAAYSSLANIGGVAATVSLTNVQLERGDRATRCLVRRSIIDKLIADSTFQLVWATGMYPSAQAGDKIQGIGALSSVASQTAGAGTFQEYLGQNNKNCIVDSIKALGYQVIVDATVTAAGPASIEQYIQVDYTAADGSA